MTDQNIALPSKPRIVEENGDHGVYEIEGLYPGYGHTLGNSLRRIILSSLKGATVTHLKIKGVSHEFSTIEGVKEDVVTIILNLKKIRMTLEGTDPVNMTLKVKGSKAVTAGDIDAPSQISIINPELNILNTTSKDVDLDIEMTVQNGIGYVAREALQKERVDVGVIALDGSFTPIRRVQYDVENMRVGDRTDFNKLKISIETNGTISPRQALEKSIETMIIQLKAIIGFKEEVEIRENPVHVEESVDSENEEGGEDFLKTRIDTLNLSTRTSNALVNAGIRTIGGLARKKEQDILELEGIGDRGVQEIKKLLGEHGIVLK